METLSAARSSVSWPLGSSRSPVSDPFIRRHLLGSRWCVVGGGGPFSGRHKLQFLCDIFGVFDVLVVIATSIDVYILPLGVESNGNLDEQLRNGSPPIHVGLYFGAFRGEHAAQKTLCRSPKSVGH